MLYEKELRRLGAFDTDLPDYIDALVHSIPSANVPYKMKVGLAISEIVRFTSQFKKYIDLGDESLIPINAITFCLAKSGVGKDSSIRAVTKCFKDSYELLTELRIVKAKEQAINMAREEGLDEPESWSVYKQFYSAPNPLEIGISTPEGLVQYLDDISKDLIGSGYVYSGEFSSELLTNVNIVDNIKILSEVYDEGVKSMKALKDKSKQTEITNSVIANALFMSSQDTILYNEAVKVKFKNEFNTKLARRSFFLFVDEDTVKKEITDVYEAIQDEMKKKEEANDCRTKLNIYTLKLTEQLLESANVPIKLAPKTEILFKLYKMYNEEEGSKISEIQSPIYKLAREHMQWKALKLSGAFALMDNSSVIEEHHYLYAIRYVELINNDINRFERELMKEPYEVFCTYMKDNAIKGKIDISLHLLRKLGYIPMKGSPVAKMKELVQLANSFDNDGDYCLDGDIIHYTEITKTSDIIVTYLPVSGDKTNRARNCSSGFVSEKHKFADIAVLLERDFAYSPFIFRGGKRGNDYIEGGCKYIVLDVDTSEITDEEAHFLLNDINHHIVRTSDPNNEFKFRVIIELDAEIDLHGVQWSYFIEVVSKDLGLRVDILPKSQIYFSYAVSKDTIRSVIDAEPLEVKPYLLKVQQMMLDGPAPIKTLSKNKKQELLDNPMETFNYAFNGRPGRRSVSLIRAAKHARDLGATKEEVIELMRAIQHSWQNKLDSTRFENTVIRQILRWQF